MTDEQRQKLERALAAALLLIYRDRSAEAFAQLGQTEILLDIPYDARERIAAFARERAQLVQNGVNQRLDRAIAAEQGTLADGEHPAIPSQPGAVHAALAEMRSYNTNTLIPFLAGRAAQYGLVDAYARTPSDTPGVSMRDGVPWMWTQLSDYQDDCSEAAAASSASYDTLVSLGGSPPPVHPRCSCSLDPVS